MKTIKKEVSHELVIQKSRFITLLYPVTSKEEVKELLNRNKQDYPNATHYCYAYIIDQEVYCSDDGEPSKTAGRPMLHVLEEQQLNHILAITIRYFGGIKLGAGGLVRAYSNSVSEALQQAEITEYTKGIEILLSFPYEETKRIDFLLKDSSIIEKKYEEKIVYRVQMDLDSFEQFQNQINQNNITLLEQKKVYIYTK